MSGKIRRLINYLQTDIWRVKSSQLPKKKSFWLKQLRTFILAVRGFAEDKCQLRAAALTFYSLLAIVPLMAMAFAIAKGFGFERYLESLLMEKMAGQEEVVGRLINFAQSFLENTKTGVIAGIGIALLFWIVVRVLGNIENSFNDIWGIRKGRTIGRKFSEYLSFMLIAPILFIIASSANVLITSQVKLITEKIALLGAFSPIIFTFLKLLPFCVMWILFTFIYIFMPNTKVKFTSGLMGGIIAGTIYQILQKIYITFQIGAAKFGAIYGSFAALPLFLVWLQLSWLIVLFGAEISFAEQNVETYEFEPDCLKVSPSFKDLLALRIIHLCVQDFVRGNEPKTASAIAHALEMPIRLVRQILFELTESHILSEVKQEEEESPAYQPAKDVDVLTIHYVLNVLHHKGIDTLPVAQTSELKKLSQCLQEFDEVIAKSPANMALKDIQ